jgi:GTPase SAR1 family protein
LFSISDRASFEQLIAFFEQACRVKDVDDTVPCVLIGAKCDLEAMREVAVSEARELAEQYRCEYIETSAKDGINCAEPFLLLPDVVDRAKEQLASQPTLSSDKVIKIEQRMVSAGEARAQRSLTTSTHLLRRCQSSLAPRAQSWMQRGKSAATESDRA